MFVSAHGAYAVQTAKNRHTPKAKGSSSQWRKRRGVSSGCCKFTFQRNRALFGYQNRTTVTRTVTTQAKTCLFVPFQ